MLTVAEGCLFAAVVMAYGVLGVAKSKPGFNNATPRDPAFYKSGIKARAYGAHNNSLEALPFFFAAVLVAQSHGAPQFWVDALSCIFIATRALYLAAYLADKPTARSFIWTAALLINTGIFFLPVFFR